MHTVRTLPYERSMARDASRRRVKRAERRSHPQSRQGEERMRIATLATTVTITLLGTIALAQSVTHDFDRAADFSKYRSYAWVRGTNLDDPLNHNRIVRAVDAQMASKGLAVVDAGASPDLLVAYHATFDKSLAINGFSSGWGGYRFGGMRTGSVRADEITVGTLIVDMVDARTKTIVWRGMATKDLDVNAKPEKRDKSINQAAAKLFKHYPPTK
jgi:hypothetical protein